MKSKVFFNTLISSLRILYELYFFYFYIQLLPYIPCQRSWPMGQRCILVLGLEFEPADEVPEVLYVVLQHHQYLLIRV